ncbi:MAG: hypothetical protein IIC50_03210 [Planctomycetes bacterium]|nr:hypothetical protein [Planctomycetota bacterium]
MDYTGIVLEQITPRAVIKAAFNAKIIADGQAWIDLLSHKHPPAKEHIETHGRVLFQRQ